MKKLVFGLICLTILFLVLGLLTDRARAQPQPGTRCEPGRDPGCSEYHRYIKFPGNPPICIPGFFDVNPGPPWAPGGCDGEDPEPWPTATTPAPIVTTVPPIVTTVIPIVTEPVTTVTQPPPTARPTDDEPAPTATPAPTETGVPYPTIPPSPYPAPGGTGNVLYAGDPAGQVCGTWWDCICYNLERIAAALERIANVLEQQ